MRLLPLLALTLLLSSTPPPPTPDRLAPPPTVPSPTQADTGAQLYWLHCQPCHGDRGQGLTDEWRDQYPPEDRNCWNAGCHGERPYEHGFTLPRSVPALIGPGTLARFQTADELHAFVSTAMPFQARGSLKPEEYWAIVAWLARGHGVEATLNADNAGAVRLHPEAVAAPDSGAWPLAFVAVVVLMLAGFWLLVARHTTETQRR
jgi:mono/diheme cytochrome c family protein